MESTANSKYWDDHWNKEEFAIAPSHHPIRQWIESQIPPAIKAEVFEIGCYPGKFLAVFGEKGYILNGLDSFFGTNSVMSGWLRDKNYKIGQFYQSDLWSFQSHQAYDVVCSFGFIEHFKNWDAALIKHIEFTKDGGYIMVDVPNLKSPLYYLLYKIFEPTVLRNHELSALSRNAICDIFEKNGCVVKTATYLGYFYFRFVTRHDKLSVALAKCINFLRPFFEFLPKSVYMRYIAVSAIKAGPRIVKQGETAKYENLA